MMCATLRNSILSHIPFNIDIQLTQAHLLLKRIVYLYIEEWRLLDVRMILAEKQKC
jgi:hypothetical protein